MPALTIALEKDDGRFLPGETIRGTLTLNAGGGTEQQQPLREGRAVVALAGGVHVEWEEGGHSGDDTGAQRYTVDRAVFPDQTQALAGPAVDDASGAITWRIALPIPTHIPPTVALPRPNGPVVGVTYTLSARLLPPSGQGETPLAEAKREVFVLPTEEGCFLEAAGAAAEGRAALEHQEESAALTTLCCFLPRGRVRTRVAALADGRVVRLPFAPAAAAGGSGVTVNAALTVENTASVARLFADVWLSDGDARHTFEDRFLVSEQELHSQLAPGQILELDKITFPRLKPQLPAPPGSALDTHARDVLQAPSIDAMGLLRLSYTLVVSAQYPTLLPNGPVILARIPVLVLPSP